MCVYGIKIYGFLLFQVLSIGANKKKQKKMIIITFIDSLSLSLEFIYLFFFLERSTTNKKRKKEGDEKRYKKLQQQQKSIFPIIAT